MPDIELDPDVLATLRALERHRVEHVLVGDAADAIHQGGRGFVDAVAIVPSGYARNVDRLAAALGALHAELRVPGEAQLVTVDLGPASLREVGRWTLATDHADVAIDFEPPGTAGYVDLFANAPRVELSGVSPHVAAAEDLDRIESATRDSAPTASPSGDPARARGRAPVPPR